MTEIFGRQWEASYGHVGGAAFLTWSESLASLSGEQIAKGLRAVIDEGSEFPPNLIKFLKLCKKKEYIYGNKYTPPALPAPDARKRASRAKEKWRQDAIKLGLLSDTMRE